VQKAPGRIGVATLPFEGKNVVVYSLPRAEVLEPGLRLGIGMTCELCEAEGSAEPDLV
jgi:hypothetical protein